MVAEPCLQGDNVRILTDGEPQHPVGKAMAHSRLPADELPQHSLPESSHPMHAEDARGDENRTAGWARASRCVAKALEHFLDCFRPFQVIRR